MNHFVRRGATPYMNYWSNRIGRVLLLLAAVLPLGAVAGKDVSPDLVRHGEQMYLINCSRCHGVHMVNPVGYTFDLRRFPPNQRERFFRSVSKGKGNMPAWGDLLKPDQIEALWAYVKTEGAKQRQ
jgi:mono/diheme cytochrome c family protein